MEQDPPHVHAPELFHPEQVVSMAEARSVSSKQQPAAPSNVGLKAAARAAANNLSEDAREGIGMVGKPKAQQGAEEGGGGKTLTARDYMFFWSG
jgi:hypothetical protein